MLLSSQIFGSLVVAPPRGGLYFTSVAVGGRHLLIVARYFFLLDRSLKNRPPDERVCFVNLTSVTSSTATGIRS